MYKNLTSSQEAEILADLERGGLGRLQSELRQNFFTEISQKIIDLFRDEVEANTGNTSGNLKSSIEAKLDQNGFDVEADFYYKFIDEGVNAAPKSPTANYTRSLQTSSPYSFKNLGVPEKMARSIRQNYGAGINQAYAIGVNIKKYGIENKDITEKVITNTLMEQVSEDISTILGLAVEVTFDKATDNTQ